MRNSFIVYNNLSIFGETHISNIKTIKSRKKGRVFWNLFGKISGKDQKGVHILGSRGAGFHNLQKRPHNRKISVSFFKGVGIAGSQWKYT